ncbi:MAG: thioredoxin family protein [Candidatus Omnitrophica bacterium]|nr:thioredoxin family protein [Candidatus Omnitrophota bacterium]
MALTPSTMLELNTQAPDFSLPDVTAKGKTVSLKDFSEKKALLVMFVSVHCPYVQHIKHALARLTGEYKNKDIAFIAVGSNDIERYPDDAPAELEKMARQLQFSFPVCYDETQCVAKSYTAACTPDFFLFDSNRKLIYRGRFDETRPESGRPATGKDLRAAIDAVLASEPAIQEQKPSVGCNIKWKPGNEPDYFKK